MAFFLQQTRGQLNDEIRLVDSRNRIGETPLMKAMVTGSTSVIRVSLGAFN
jgi:hypothetical protein